MKTKHILIVVAVLIALGVGGFFLYKKMTAETDEDKDALSKIREDLEKARKNLDNLRNEESEAEEPGLKLPSMEVMQTARTGLSLELLKAAREAKEAENQ